MQRAQSGAHDFTAGGVGSGSNKAIDISRLFRRQATGSFIRRWQAFPLLSGYIVGYDTFILSSNIAGRASREKRCVWAVSEETLDWYATYRSRIDGLRQ